MLTARCAAWCSSAKARSDSPSSSGVSPAATITVPVVVPDASIATRTACPVPSCVSWTASTADGTSSVMCGPTCSRWWPTTATTLVGSTACTAWSTWPIMERPPIGCSTFMVFDFMRVPPPAARTMTVRLSMAAVCHRSLRPREARDVGPYRGAAGARSTGAEEEAMTGSTPLRGGDDVSCVDLYWLPLGAGGRCVRLNGRVFEALVARREHRRAADLYHSALEVRLGPDRWVVEMAPVWNTPEPERGVVAEGPVGLRWLGRSRWFRYEVRCWRGGRIPDVDEAVDSPVRMSDDAWHARAGARPGAALPHRHLGAGRAAHRRHVELELAHVVAARPQRPRPVPGRPARRRPGAGVGRRPRGRVAMSATTWRAATGRA